MGGAKALPTLPLAGRTLNAMSDQHVREVDIDEVNRPARGSAPTPDDQSLLWDGTRLDSAEKVVAWLVDIGDMTPEAAEEFLANR